MNTAAVVTNPYGVSAFLFKSGWLSHGVLIVLFLMSLSSWYLILVKLWDQRKLKQAGRNAEKRFWTAPSVKDGIDRLKKGDHYRHVAEEALRAQSHHEGRLSERIDLDEWINMSLQRSITATSNDLQAGMGWLASVGSTAPFVGLFGTVVGIIQALVSIGVSGQPSIDKVAGPVGEALIMTAAGLLVAVPAVLGYNWLIGRNKLVLETLRNFAGDLHTYLIGGARVGGADVVPARPTSAQASAAPAAAAVGRK
ncbi:MAG: MotA/TolQ/ExbB proton channel family protein [Steroidobacteraceae bacterium]